MKLRILEHRLLTSAKELKQRAYEKGLCAAQLKDEMLARLPADKLQVCVGKNVETGGEEWVDVPRVVVGLTIAQIEGSG